MFPKVRIRLMCVASRVDWEAAPSLHLQRPYVILAFIRFRPPHCIIAFPSVFFHPGVKELASWAAEN